MTSNLLTEGRQALLQRLQTITPGNGYRTAAGNNVRSGWLNELLQREHCGFPLIVLQHGKGGSAPRAGAGAIRLDQGFNVIGAVDVGLESYQDALDDLQLDLLQALLPGAGRPLDWAPPGISGLTLGAPEAFPPGDGQRAACILIPLQLHPIIRTA